MSSSPPSIPLEGLWLWLSTPSGPITYNQAGWDALCRQAKSWGMTGLHPKVADGGRLWYTYAELTMLRDVAHTHGLQVAPWTYNYGNTYGALATEAEILASVGAIFGVVIPDVEKEWENSTPAIQWAYQMGQLVRGTHGYHGKVLPTTFALPQWHPLPLLTFFSWVDGWMPQVYFAEWTPQTAQSAIDVAFKQWLTLDAEAKARNIPSRPILPIIEVGNHLASGEIASWLTKMRGYGYCGFWYGPEAYGPYASAVTSVTKGGQFPGPPVHLPPPPPHPTPTPHPVPIEHPVVPPTQAHTTPPYIPPPLHPIVLPSKPVEQLDTRSVPIVTPPLPPVPVVVPPTEDWVNDTAGGGPERVSTPPNATHSLPPPTTTTTPAPAPADMPLPEVPVSQKAIQQMSEALLEAVWLRHVSQPFLPNAQGLCQYWCWLINDFPEIAVGSPTSAVQDEQWGGRSVKVLHTELGRSLFFDAALEQYGIV